MTGSTTKTSPTQRKFTVMDIVRCVLVTVASAPVAWLSASLLSHRTLSNHEQIGTIAFTVLLLGNAMRYSIRSWKWSAIFLSVLLLFPLVFDRRCLLLASLAIPMLTAVAMYRWVTRRWVLVAMASVGAGVAAVLGSSALLAPWSGLVDRLLVNAWDVQWSMRGEQEQLSQARGDWEQAIGNADVKELETWAKRELQAVKATEQEARQKEHGDYLQDAIGLYRRATEQLRQAQQLMTAVAQARLTWERAMSADDFEPATLIKYANAEFAQAQGKAQEAASRARAGDADSAVRLYDQAVKTLQRTRISAASALLAEAQANDSKERGPAALAALDKLLKLDPNHAEAMKLRRKVLWYDLTVDLGGGVTMKFVPIRAGEFLMGSPAGEVGHQSDETQHKVKLTKTFYMQTTPVTQAQWKTVMGADPSNFKGDDLPVETVSWNDAVDFCRRLGEKEGKHYRLPTEAEWEYACRAGTTTRFYTGDDDQSLDRAGWHGGNSGNKTHPVGQKQPNAFGLYDMHGNVWQWCSDVYNSNYPAGPVFDPTGPAQNQNASRVLRGGSWISGSVGCRSAFRYWGAPDFRNYGVGFRVVLDSP